jgi:peroxiredoxin
MTAWEADQKTAGTMVKLLGDTRMELTKALGTVLDHPGPMGVLGNNRCQRFSMYISDCKIKAFNLAAAGDDPAGDDRPEVSMAEKMLEDLKALKIKSEL